MTSHRKPEIMVFRPTEEEFKNFPAYVKKMEKQRAHEASIAKVIPPASWFARRSYVMEELGSMVINTPILQLVNGRQGVYQLTNVLKKSCTVKEFHDLAISDRYKQPAEDIDFNELERKFWKTLAFNPPMYGADLPGSIYDSDVKTWNIGSLPSILDLLESEFDVKILGVNTPYLYFGMWRAMFPWHIEDMDLYSINYLHFGAPKSWYAIPSEHGQRFESLAQGFFSDSSHHCSQFLRHKITLLSPSVLEKYYIPYNKVTQNAGEFIITFPHGYHSGFNHGFNCAESTNFALERWVDYGMEAKVCSCTNDSVKINMAPFVKKYRPEKYADFMKTMNYSADAVPNKSKDAKTSLNRKLASSTTAKQKRTLLPPLRDKGGKIRNLQALFSALFNNPPPSAALLKEYNLVLAKASVQCAICVAFSSEHVNRLSTNTNPKTKRRSSPNSDRQPLASELCYAWSSGEPSIVAVLQESTPSSVELRQCKTCNVSVHTGCYLGRVESPSKDWRCDVCQSCHGKSGVSFWKMKCALCLVGGGAMKATTCGKWVHVVCAIANPLVRFGNVATRSDIDISDTLDNVVDSSVTCCHCHRDNGSLVECSRLSCREVLHASCSLNHGVPIVQREWPFAVNVVCPRHWQCQEKTTCKTSERTFRVNDKVIAKHKNCRYYNGTVRQVDEKFYYRVIFDDGSYCKDVPPNDVKPLSDAGSRQVTVPVGDPVTVSWTDGVIYNAKVTGHSKVVRLQIHFEDDSLLFVKASDVYNRNDTVPDKVSSKLSRSSFVRSETSLDASPDVTECKRARLPNARYSKDEFVV